jgi:chromosome partitioning protein
MFIFAFANQKGGVGKTTTAVTLASGFSQHQKKTLLIDLDPQGHVAFSFGLDKTPGLYRWLVLDEPLSEVVQTVRPGLDILSSDKRTESVKRHITLMDFRETLLLDRLQISEYDVILLDMAPSLDVLHINGLIASDWVIIPTRPDAMAVDGVKEILLTLAEIDQRGHQFAGYSILPTFFDRTTRETVTQFQDIVQAFGDKVLPPIPQDTRVREAAAYGKTLWEYSPNSPAMSGYSDGKNQVGGYRQIVERLLEVIDG